MEVSQKICSKCKTLKALEEFNFRYKKKNIRHGYCKECGKILTRSHYKRNKRQYLNKNSSAYQKCREFIRQSKRLPCADCGVSYPYYVMDFDHRQGEIKEYGLNRSGRASIEKVKEEIAKCDVVCSNCHRERTHQRAIQSCRVYSN